MLLLLLVLLLMLLLLLMMLSLSRFGDADDVGFVAVADAVVVVGDVMVDVVAEIVVVVVRY